MDSSIESPMSSLQVQKSKPALKEGGSTAHTHTTLLLIKTVDGFIILYFSIKKVTKVWPYIFNNLYLCVYRNRLPLDLVAVCFSGYVKSLMNMISICKFRP